MDISTVLLVVGAFWTGGWLVGFLTGRWTKGETK